MDKPLSILNIQKEIVFNKPYFSGKELHYIQQVVETGKTSGNGHFTRACQQYFQDRYEFPKCFITTSCTDALEMAAILSGIGTGDEVILPSYTFVSTANPFLLRGAKVIFCDSNTLNPNIDPDRIEALITPKTKAIAVVHYAGIACDMNKIMAIANRHDLLVIEDAAQAVDSFYKGKPLGSFGHFAAFSFHETKNISSGEGGMLVVNDERFHKKAEIVWDKGTNRASFFRGEVDKYSWVDMGSSFLASEITAAFLLAQLEDMELIQEKRKGIWNVYQNELDDLKILRCFELPELPSLASNNAQIFYVLLPSGKERDRLSSFLKMNGIQATFHYHSLHKSPYYNSIQNGVVADLPNADKYSERLLRLPLHFYLSENDVLYVVQKIKDFYKG